MNKTRLSRSNTVLCTLACVTLVFGGMGSQCPGSSSSATFKATDVPSATVASTVKSWQSPKFVDPAAASSSAFGDQNFNMGTGVNEYFPMSVFSHGSRSFKMLLNHECDTGNNASAVCYADGEKYGYAVSISSFLETWISSLANFTPMAALGVSTDHTVHVFNTKTVVDAYSNATSISNVTTDNGDSMITMQHYNSSGNYWTAVNYSQAASRFYSAAESFQPHSTAMAVVPSSNQVVVQSCRTDDQALHAVYTPYSTWSSVTSDWTDCSAFGLDLAFDNSGRGVGAYTSNTNDTVYARKWCSGGWHATTIDVSVGSFDIFPRVFVDPSASPGHASIFVYRAASHLGAAGIRRISCSYNCTGAFACVPDATDMDNGLGAGNVITDDGTNYLKPILVSSGSSGALFFVKNDTGGNAALWFSSYLGSGTWSTPALLQDSVSVNHSVTWADAAINASGQIAVVYSAYDSTNGGAENVFGTVYSDGSWSTATQLDNWFILGQAVSPANGYYMPSVAIDADGNAVATFSMENLFSTCGAGNCRRAVAVPYR